MLVLETDPMKLFRGALSNPVTRDRYETRLKLILTQMGIEGKTFEEKARSFVSQAKKDSQWASSIIWTYLQEQRERAEGGELSYSTLPNLWKPLKLLLEMNDVQVNWKKITRGIPRGRNYALDRAPTKEEIKRILEYPDRRIKAIVLVMASSGIRLGAWEYLRWEDVEPVEREGRVVAAKLTVYRGDPEQYQTYITSEAYAALKEWMEFRAKYGEKISPSSWAMRDLWKTNERNGASLPRKLKPTGIKMQLERALWTQGLRQKLEKGKRRHEFKTSHCFRKYFKSQSEKTAKSLHVEILMGHSLGLGDNYYRPEEGELLESYLKAIPYLTILKPENQTIPPQIKNLEKDNKELRTKLETLEEELKLLKKEVYHHMAPTGFFE